MDNGEEEGKGVAEGVIDSLMCLSEAALDVDGCDNCNTCEDLTDCLMGLRRAVGYIAECMARIIESNERINKLLMKYIQEGFKIKKKDLKEDFKGFYS